MHCPENMGNNARRAASYLVSCVAHPLDPVRLVLGWHTPTQDQTSHTHKVPSRSKPERPFFLSKECHEHRLDFWLSQSSWISMTLWPSG